MRHRAQAGHEIGELLDLLRLDELDADAVAPAIRRRYAGASRRTASATARRKRA